jgi:F-type H+/Na+-transporting ATPase subunit alpha
LAELRGKGESLLAAIRKEKQISPATEEKLKAFMEEYTKAFA